MRAWRRTGWQVGDGAAVADGAVHGVAAEDRLADQFSERGR